LINRISLKARRWGRSGWVRCGGGRGAAEAARTGGWGSVMVQRSAPGGRVAGGGGRDRSAGRWWWTGLGWRAVETTNGMSAGRGPGGYDQAGPAVVLRGRRDPRRACGQPRGTHGFVEKLSWTWRPGWCAPEMPRDMNPVMAWPSRLRSSETGGQHDNRPVMPSHADTGTTRGGTQNTFVANEPLTAPPPGTCLDSSSI